MVAGRTFSSANIQMHTNLSKSYIYGKIKEYAEKGFIRRAGLGSNGEKLWRMTQKGKRLFDPNAPKEPVILTLSSSQKDLGGKKPKLRPEHNLWAAIKEFKKFITNDLLEMKLASETTVRQYVALLARAGFLNKKRLNDKKKNKGEGCYPLQYTLVGNPGDEAPLMGRVFYVFDPNTGKYWTTPMEGLED